MKLLDPNLNGVLVDAGCRPLSNNHESVTNPHRRVGGLFRPSRFAQRTRKDSSAWIHGVRLWLLPLALLCAKTAAFETMAYGPLQLQTTVEARVGLQYGTGINYGLGAIDDLTATERATIAVALEPKLSALWALDTSQIYGGISVVAATTSLDGEISGQFGRAGDQAFDSDNAYLGWRSGAFDISFGAQEFWVSDGFIIGDGNLDTGGADGQVWVVPFGAWRNSAILRFASGPWRGDAFWLRADVDFGHAEVVGINIENDSDFATVGAMYLEIVDGDTFNYDGINLWNLRATRIRIPGVEGLELFAEFALESGTDVDGGGRNNAASAWYFEGQYRFSVLPATPTLIYRYSRFSGDELDTPDNEEYRGLFYTFLKREFDSWYQGEIAGEYHLFNQNQITHMVKLKVQASNELALSVYYYRHDLEEPQYLGTPLKSTAWADEVNLSVEYTLGERFFCYAGVAWSRPDTAARTLFGDDDFTVVQTLFYYAF